MSEPRFLFDPAPPDTLAEARRELRAKLDDGTTCPCCGKFAKRYRIRVGATVAAWLVALVRLSGREREWVHASRAASLVVRPGKSAVGYAYLEHWGLIERCSNIEETPEGAKPGRTGLWRPTDRGVRFVLGDLCIRERAILYNNVLEGFEGGFVDIRETLRTRFDYHDLMRPMSDLYSPARHDVASAHHQTAEGGDQR